ncbi:MAG: SpoIIE family protein phosphatase [Methylacidiphilales bacterium]|nr:SpoIIE family protein phosphatase [Candidatus Methylacidiphilales bacterium]
MHGIVLYLVGLGTALVVISLLYNRKKLNESRRLQADLRREFAALQQEKKVIYDFLHDLGEAFTEEIDREHLLRIIVTCARKVTGAKGAAIYLWDADREKLVAAIVSGTFPPVLKVDNIVADQLAARSENLEAFLRLEAIPADSTSVIGEVAQTGVGIHAERAEQDERFPWFRQKNLQTETYMAVPLHYRQEQLGVLALANHEEGKPFSKADFDLVHSVADQAAYSLQHAQVYSQLAEKKKLDHDISVAREIQRILLPSRAPTVEGFNCAALNIPAQQVSGDYFDFIQVDSRRWGVAVADVSGKGIPASLIMAMCRSVLRSKAPGNSSPAQVLREVNRQLYPDIQEDMFITMIYLIMDPSGVITLARAGHESAFLCKDHFKHIEAVDAPGMALGIDAGDVFDEVIKDVTVELSPLDTVVVYTDGINEALDDEGNEFGQEQLKAVLQEAGPQSVDFLVKTIVDRVQNFSSGHPQNDDITLAAVQRSD